MLLKVFFSLLLLIFVPLFFPSLPLLFFAPYLICICYRYSRFSSLLHAALTGLLIDLFSTHQFFGVSIMNAVLTIFIIHWFTHFLIEEKLFTLSVMTAFFALTHSIFEIGFGLFIHRNVSITWQGVMSDLCSIAFINGLYAFVLFTLPAKCVKLFKNLRISHT